MVMCHCTTLTPFSGLKLLSAYRILENLMFLIFMHMVTGHALFAYVVLSFFSICICGLGEFCYSKTLTLIILYLEQMTWAMYMLVVQDLTPTIYIYNINKFRLVLILEHHWNIKKGLEYHFLLSVYAKRRSSSTLKKQIQKLRRAFLQNFFNANFIFYRYHING